MKLKYTSRPANLGFLCFFVFFTLARLRALDFDFPFANDQKKIKITQELALGVLLASAEGLGKSPAVTHVKKEKWESGKYYFLV